MRVRENMRASFKLSRLTFCIILVFSIFSVAFQPQQAYAAQITNRSLTLQSGATDGGSKPGGVVNHEFNFIVPNTGTPNVGSIKFLYCNEAVGSPDPSDCTTPTGLVTTGGSTALGYEDGATGFTLDKATNGAPYLTRSAASIPVNTELTYRLTNITNPTAVNQSFFVRISTYTSTDATGSPIDTGVVTASTATQIVLTGIMPESLIFCTGEDIDATAGIPDCSTANAGDISFNQLFSPSDTATAKSEFAISTNAIYGYSVSVFGPTMTSGANTVTPMAGGVGVRGTSQFGMNLKLNTVATSTVPVGAEVDPAPDGTDLKGQASVANGYGTVDNFKFVAGGAGNPVAASDNGGAGPTNAQIFTASYIVNVSGNQVSGTYTTTLTYIATSTF